MKRDNMADDKIALPLTQTHVLRVELLKLAYRHDRSTEDIVKRATDLEVYVSGTVEQSPVIDGQAEPDSPI